MKKVTYKCDRCGEEIADTVYSLTCYAEDLVKGPCGGVSGAMVQQNFRQSQSLQAIGERHLCGMCKDELTDGLFIV